MGFNKTEDFKHSKCGADLMPKNLPVFFRAENTGV
jgi:hypothetical protein